MRLGYDVCLLQRALVLEAVFDPDDCIGTFGLRRAANFWQTAAHIFTTANAIYAFIIQRFEGPDQTTTLSTSDLS
jgi:hypothetical protein